MVPVHGRTDECWENVQIVFSHLKAVSDTSAVGHRRTGRKFLGRYQLLKQALPDLDKRVIRTDHEVLRNSDTELLNYVRRGKEIKDEAQNVSTAHKKVKEKNHMGGQVAVPVAIETDWGIPSIRSFGLDTALAENAGNAAAAADNSAYAVPLDDDDDDYTETKAVERVAGVLTTRNLRRRGTTQEKLAVISSRLVEVDDMTCVDACQEKAARMIVNSAQGTGNESNDAD